MSFEWALPVGFAFFLAVAGSMRAGWLYGRRRIRSEGSTSHEGLGSIDAAIFGMMGLLLAFTFTGAASRFDARRDLIVQETNAIGTAWLRLDLLQAEPREQLRGLFREYLDHRLALYRDVTDTATTQKELARIAALQSEIWRLLQAQLREDKSQLLPIMVLPPVNDMFDIATTRVLATRQHPPVAVYVMLGFLILVSAFLAGFGRAEVARQSGLHLIGFAATTALAFYLIIDMEYPRLGLIRVDSFDQALIDLRASMEPQAAPAAQ